jgi:hypothetical protein
MSSTECFRISTLVQIIRLPPRQRQSQNKYAQLGRKYLLGDIPTIKDEEAAGLRDIPYAIRHPNLPEEV